MSFTVDFTDTPFLSGVVGAHSNRLNWRAELLLTRNRKAIEGKRVIDLACADGRFSYACTVLNAAHVIGVEGRPEQVERARAWFLSLAIDEKRCEFELGDVFNYLARCKSGEFDTILCFGFFYHTLRQVELMQELHRLKPKYLIMDTTVSPERHWRRPAKFLWRLRPRHLNPKELVQHWQSIEGDEIMYFKTEHADHPSGTIENNFWGRAEWEKGHAIGATFKPTESLVERLFDVHGFSFRQIAWTGSDGNGIKDWAELEDYKRQRRVSYLASPKS